MKIGDKVVLIRPFSSPVMVVFSINLDDVTCTLKIDDFIHEVTFKAKLLKSAPEPIIGMIDINPWGRGASK